MQIAIQRAKEVTILHKIIYAYSTDNQVLSVSNNINFLDSFRLVSPSIFKNFH